MATEFGPFLGDGDLANRFRFSQIEPPLGRGQTVVFDFAGVDNITDSFANACFGTLAEEHPDEFGRSIRFRNCSPLVRHFIAAAVALGRARSAKLHR